MIEIVHNTAKDISKIYKTETIIPGFIAYGFWFVVLFVTFMVKGELNGKER